MPTQQSMQNCPAVLTIPSVDDSPGMKLLPFVLTTIAGCVDVIGFLGLGGLFTAHVTGNVVILAAKLLLFISDWYLPEPPSAFPSHAQFRSSWPGGTGRCVGGRRSDRHEAPPI